MRPAVFLDRDGTIIEDVGYLDAIERLKVFPWSIDAIRALNRAAMPVVVVTNQSGVARGILDEALVDIAHRYLSERLAAGGARVDAYYYCPHHPRGSVAAFARVCDCRKPARGMIDRAVADLGIDAARSFVVGDKWIDVQLAQAVGARALLVRTGGGAAEERRPPEGVSADAVVDNLAAAASWILRESAINNNPQSAIRNPQSTMNPQSAIRNPQC
jgi:D-glycero-D-manno-heptose 1,7-bisphosphate phosphatase